MWTQFASLTLPLAVACALSYTIAWIVRVVAPKIGLLDAPRADRWHRTPVARLGGIAIYLGFSVSVLLQREVARSAVIPLLVACTAIFLVGVIDDVAGLPNRVKLLLLLGCAALPVLMQVRFAALPVAIGVPLAAAWILGATNAFNWLDNMDGVATGVAAIASLCLFAFALVQGNAALAPLPLLLAGATLGFLAHNFPPARVFMGDSGSGFLGLTLSVTAVMVSPHDKSHAIMSVLTPGLILAVPIFDFALVTFHRLRRRRALFQGGRDHLAHRLVAIGLSERKVALFLYGLCLSAGVVGIAAAPLGVPVGVGLSGLAILGFLTLGLVVSDVPVYDERPPRWGEPPPQGEAVYGVLGKEWRGA